MRIWLLLLALLMPVTAESHLPVTGSLQVERREIQHTIAMLDRDGRYSILEVSLPADELARLAA